MKSILILTLIVVSVCASPHSSRIWAGYPAILGQFPHAVSLIISKGVPGQAVLCGGSIIHERWVITAGHCLRDAIGLNYTIGQINKRPVTGYIDNRANFIIHEDNKPFEKDIALIRMPTPIKMTNNVKPIAMPPRTNPLPNYSNQWLIALGWGKLSDTAGNSDNLQFTYTRTVDLNTCKRTIAQATEDHICVRKDNSGPCSGDSGNGLITDDNPPKLLGVFSMLKGCANSNPAVYTRVERFYEWINANTGLIFW